MTKTKEELAVIKKQCETLNNKLKELSEDELAIVTGGISIKNGISNDPNIRVRGASTIQSSPSPLFVIDGYPTNNNDF